MSQQQASTTFDDFLGIPRSVLEFMLFRLIGLVLVFLLHVVLANMMGAKIYGDYVIVISWLQLLVVVSTFGMESSAAQFLPVLVSQKKYGEAAGFVRFSFRLITIVSVICSIGVFLFLLFYGLKKTVSFKEGLFWSVFLLPVLALVHQSSAVLRAFQRIKASVLPLQVTWPVLMVITAGWYYLENNKLPIDAIMLLQLVCTLIVGWLVQRKKNRRLDIEIATAEPVYEWKSWLSSGSFNLLLSLAEFLLKHADVITVGYVISHIQSGRYYAATAIASIVAFGLTVTDQAYMPGLRSAFLSGKRKVLQEKLRSATRQVFMITLPVVLVFMLAGRWLLSAFGSSFEQAYIPLLILLSGQLFHAAIGMSGGLLSVAGHRHRYLIYATVSVIVQLIALFLVLPSFGLVGAALTVTLSRILLNLLCFIFLKKRYSVSASLL
ncbi:MAG: hypothetical protein RIQ47_868 [Bacteroidota bacterium]|jgi:O-antigen/teichoic acid export membrane protein